MNAVIHDAIRRLRALSAILAPLAVLALLLPAGAAVAQTPCDSVGANLTNIGPNCRISFNLVQRSHAGIFYKVRLSVPYPDAFASITPPSGWNQTVVSANVVVWDSLAGGALPFGPRPASFVLSTPAGPVHNLTIEFLDAANNVLCTKGMVFDCQATQCMRIDSLSVTCAGKDASGNQEYTATFRVWNGLGVASLLNISSMQGSLMPNAILPAPGVSVQTVTFTDLPPVDAVLGIVGTLSNTAGVHCDDSTQAPLPQCPPQTPCLTMDTVQVVCGQKDPASGNQTYTVTFSVYNGLGAGAVLNLSSLQGSFVPASVNPPAGYSLQTVQFIDTPPVDVGVMFSGMLVGGGTFCYDSIATKLPDCPQTPCLDLKDVSVVCGPRDPQTGAQTYTMSITVFNGGGAGAVLQLNSPQGSFLPSSFLPPAGTSVVNTVFTDTPPADPVISVYGMLISATGLDCPDTLRVQLPPCPPPTGACGRTECRLDSMIVNSGYNHSTNGVYGIGQQDGYWELVQSPNVSLTLPSPPWVIAPIPAWAPPQPNSQWLSAYNNSALNMNNAAPMTPYRFQYCFCTCEGIDSIVVDVKLLADNDATLLLDGVPFYAFPNNNAVSNFQQGAHVVWGTRLQPGTHCLQVDLRNISGGWMGFNLAGAIRTVGSGPRDVFIAPACCDTTGTVIGQKIFDKNCNGKVDVSSTGQPLETGLQGWTMTLNPGSYTAVTDASGFFYFNNVPAGTYTVSETMQTGWTQTAPGGPGTFTVTVLPNQVVQVTFLNCQNPPKPCDDFLHGELDTSCCEYKINVINVTGSITKIKYTITGGTLQSISTLPCTFTSVPAVLTGTTTGVLNYSPACTSNPQINVAVNPTTNTGDVCISWVVYHKNGDSCVYKTCYTCERAPQTACDIYTAKPFYQQNVSIDYRTFTIFNLKIPYSPICSIDIDIRDAGGNQPTSGWQGGDLYVDNALIPTGTRFVFPYNRIPNAGAPTLASYNADTVRFNLGIDYTINFTGTVKFVIRHCDGDSCVVTYGPWKATKPGGPILVSVSTVATNKKLTGQHLQVKNLSGSDPVRWVSIAVEDRENTLYAISGAQWAGQPVVPGGAILSGAEQGSTAALFTFETALLPGETSGLINVVVAQDSAKTGRPVIRWVTYGEDGTALATDTVSVGSTVLSVAGDPAGSVPPGDFRLLQSFPNPSRSDVTINYALGAPMRVRLELFDASGRQIATLAEGDQMEGMNTVRYITAGLSPGRYFLRLSSGDRVAQGSFLVVH